MGTNILQSGLIHILSRLRRSFLVSITPRHETIHVPIHWRARLKQRDFDVPSSSVRTGNLLESRHQVSVGQVGKSQATGRPLSNQGAYRQVRVTTNPKCSQITLLPSSQLCPISSPLSGGRFTDGIQNRSRISYRMALCQTRDTVFRPSLLLSHLFRNCKLPQLHGSAWQLKLISPSKAQ